jgi:hypothetical protein
MNKREHSMTLVHLWFFNASYQRRMEGVGRGMVPLERKQRLKITSIMLNK